MDENRKLSLPNGEMIYIGQQTNIIFECENVKNLTPATISRCGLIHVDRDRINTPKYAFNQYLLRLPPNLAENVKEIEIQVNQLMPACFHVMREEKQAGRLLFDTMDEFWLTSSFIKIFDSFVQGYWIDFINQNKSDWEDRP